MRAKRAGKARIKIMIPQNACVTDEFYRYAQEKNKKIHGKFLGGFAVEKSFFAPIFEP